MQDYPDSAGDQAPNAPTHRRLLGWLVFLTEASSQPWVVVDLDRFAERAGVCKRTAERALKQLRSTGEGGLKFRTVWKHRDGRKGHWQVLCASQSNLRHDREPLFHAKDGRPRHLRTELRGETVRRDRHAIIGSVPKGNQQSVNGPRPLKALSAPGSARLRAKAGSTVDRLSAMHWDNCKVDFCRGMAFTYAFEALRDGHTERRILIAYDIALHRSHGTATDLGDRFALSSTVAKARAWLAAQDSLSPAERISEFYNKRRAETSALLASLRAHLSGNTLGNSQIPATP